MDANETELTTTSDWREKAHRVGGVLREEKMSACAGDSDNGLVSVALDEQREKSSSNLVRALDVDLPRFEPVAL